MPVTRIFLSAGEASGDAYGAALVTSMREKRGDLQFEAIGGRRLRASGTKIVADSSTWGAIGIWQSTLVGLRIVLHFHRIKRLLATGERGLFIPIDFGFMNIRLARHAKNHGWKVLYFVPPGSWRRDKQGADLPVITDAISTPFEWSAAILQEMGAHAYWFGHPIKQLLANTAEVARSSSIAVLPGSRNHEIDNNLPVIAQAVNSDVEFALAPSVDLETFRAQWEKLNSSVKATFTVGDTAGVLRRARAAIVCSGTATLEAALCGTPMVVMYRASKAMELEAKIIRFKRPKFIALPNIVLDRPVVEELIQESATPDALRSELEKISQDGPDREAQLASFSELETLLGHDDAISQTAQLALQLIDSSR